MLVINAADLHGTIGSVGSRSKATSHAACMKETRRVIGALESVEPFSGIRPWGFLGNPRHPDRRSDSTVLQGPTSLVGVPYCSVQALNWPKSPPGICART